MIGGTNAKVTTGGAPTIPVSIYKYRKFPNEVQINLYRGSDSSGELIFHTTVPASSNTEYVLGDYPIVPGEEYYIDGTGLEYITLYEVYGSSSSDYIYLFQYGSFTMPDWGSLCIHLYGD
jgi:hypothetical protein